MTIHAVNNCGSSPTNLTVLPNSMIEVDNKALTLARLKLMIDGLRSELAQLDVINERNIFAFRRRRIATSEEEEKEVAQLSDIQLETSIKKLEQKKIALETILETHNANTQLVE
ncbi:MAG: hypothetical protein ACFFC3_15395 [Candidatus Odinarchaeota archaeon]